MRDVYLKRIEKIPEDKRSSWRFHVVRAGESLDGIASSLHGRPSEIATANNLDANTPIEAGDELVVPVANAVAAAHPLHYVTRARDTLVTVADRFNISVEDLRRWNHLSSSTIRPGRSLAVSEPIHLAPATHVRTRRARAGASTRSKAGAKTGPNVKSAARVSTSSAAKTSQSKTQNKAVAARQNKAPN
jgi:membrane-bound lytic murein transglycosylase D